MLYGRLYPRLDQEQAEDQAGFRSSYQTKDDLATYRMIEQKCHERGIKMWIATIDFTNACDSITHKSIWKALNSCGRNHEYISLLKKIYKDQKALVQTDVESNMFEIKKGTKQGDLLSSLLFNTVLQSSLKEITQRWQKKKGMGIYLSDHDHDGFTNLRFAGDVLLFATSKEQLQKMMYEFKESTEKVWLRIHPGKTKVLSNQSSEIRKEIEIDDISRIADTKRKHEILQPDDYFPATGDDRNQKANQGCLGDAPQVQARADNEKLPAQISTLAVFDAVVTPTMCHASGTWTPTKKHERMIQSTQRKMLRLIIPRTTKKEAKTT